MNFASAHDQIGIGRPGGYDRPERPGPNYPGGNDRPDRPGQERPGQRVVYKSVDSYRIQKLIETTNTSRVNAPYVKQVLFTARDNAIEITEARLLLDNGREVYMDGVTGGLRQGRTVAYTLDGRWGDRVRSITIRAVSRSLVGARPTLDVSVGVFQ